MKSEQLSDVSLHMALSYIFEIPQRIVSLIISCTNRLLHGREIITWTNTFPSWLLLLKQGQLICTSMMITDTDNVYVKQSARLSFIIVCG